jgi:hypothetical protein
MLPAVSRSSVIQRSSRVAQHTGKCPTLAGRTLRRCESRLIVHSVQACLHQRQCRRIRKYRSPRWLTTTLHVCAYSGESGHLINSFSSRVSNNQNTSRQAHHASEWGSLPDRFQPAVVQSTSLTLQPSCPMAPLPVSTMAQHQTLASKPRPSSQPSKIS